MMLLLTMMMMTMMMMIIIITILRLYCVLFSVWLCVSMWSTNPHSSVALYSDNVNVVPELQLLSYVRMFDNEIVW